MPVYTLNCVSNDDPNVDRVMREMGGLTTNWNQIAMPVDGDVVRVYCARRKIYPGCHAILQGWVDSIRPRRPVHHLVTTRRMCVAAKVSQCTGECEEERPAEVCMPMEVYPVCARAWGPEDDLR